jgi:hypothetical protein
MIFVKIVKKLALVAMFFFMLFMLYLGALFYFVDVQDEEAKTLCDKAMIGEDINHFKKRIGRNGVFNEDRNEYIFLFYTPAFSAASCNLKVEENKIVSKRVKKTEGG